MPNSHTEVYVHFVWSTWDREPLVTADIEDRVYACIRARCRDMQAHLNAIGGVADHVHVLLRLPATLSLAPVAKDMKGASSHFVTHVLGRSGFRWQGAYSAFGVCEEAIETAAFYIESQKQHHARNTLRDRWEPSND
jgi:REP element-mobilizing transposase RayT